MSRKGWGWWQELQSGEYRKTPKLSQGTPSPSITKATVVQNSSAISTLYNAQFRSSANTNNQSRPSLPNAIKKPQIKKPQINGPQTTIAKIQMMLNEGYEENTLHKLLSSALN